jgi:predicted AAA+ superfamily ATPase
MISLPERDSFFLFGARQTGKSTLIASRFQTGLWTVNLLLSDSFLAYSKDPALFRREAEEKIKSGGAQTIFVDEIQRVPELLNEIHALMAQYPKCRFILTGSSARKLRRGGINLLGGRAVERHLFPFVREELGEGFSLEDALLYGTLPPIVGKTPDERRDFLAAYVHTYLREEIQSEGIARNLGGFSRFLDVAAQQCGELVNFSAIGRECALPTRTVQSYYDILVDTLVGLRLEPWRKSVRKRLMAHPKVYLFDLGVTNAVNRRLTGSLDPVVKGRLFEQWVVLETHRRLQYARSEAGLFFWQTNHGAEVDLLIAKHGQIRAAIEIKVRPRIAGADLSGLRAFREEHAEVPCFVVCTAPHAFEVDGVKVLPWKQFLDRMEEWF